MSGLVVRPGDVLVVPLHPPSDHGTDARMKLARIMEADMPGVRVIVMEGVAGGPFVYRPDPPDPPDPPTPPTLPCCGFTDVHASFCSTRRATDVPDCPCGTVDLAARPSSRFEGQLGWDIMCAGCGNDLMYVLDFDMLPKERNIIVTRRDW